MALLQHVEDREHGPGAELDFGGQAVRNHARDVLDEAAAGDVGHALDYARLEQGREGLDVDLGGGEQHVAELFAAQLVEFGVHGVAGLLEQGLAHQGEAIGVYAGGGQADEHVAFSDGGTVHDGGLFGNADRESGEIVFVFVVHARHFGGFAADQRGTGLYTAVGHTGHDLLKQCRVVLAAGDVVKEEQRLGALGGDVVDAHGHAVDADGVVLVGQLGDHELGAHAVGAGDEDRLLVAQGGQIEQAAEAADAADHAGAVRAGHVRLDALDDFVPGFDAHAGVLICFWHLVGLSTYFGSPLEGSCRQSRLRGGKRLWFKELLLSGLVVSYSASGCTVLYSLPMYLLLYSANSGRRTRSSGVRDFRKSAS